MGFYEEIQKVRKEKNMQEFSNWPNTLYSDVSKKTDCEGWKEGMKQFVKTNGDVLREVVENIGKEI